MAENPRTIVLLSGGMNSAAMLYEMLTFRKTQIVECMIFDTEPPDTLVIARELCERTGVLYSVWDHVTDPIISCVPDLSGDDPTLSRALLFTTMINYAVYRAQVLDAKTIAAGFCPDGLPFDATRLIEFCCHAGRAASDTSHLLNFEFPFINKSKARVFELAKNLNRLVEVCNGSASCDQGDESLQHPWGYGCGSCRGCVARWHAWDEYLQIIGQGPKA